MQLKKGCLKKPLTISKGQGFQPNALIRSVHSRKPRLVIKKTKARSTSTCHARMGYDALPSGSNEWTEEKLPATLRMTPQGTSPSLLTYTPQKNTTTSMTKTLLGHYPHGSSLPLVGVGPHSPHFATSSTNSPSTTGVSWQKSTDTGLWMSS